MVKPIIERMRAQGANDFTINAFLIFFMIFMLVVTIGLLVIIGYDSVVRNVSPPIWAIGAFTTIIGIVGILFGVSHTVNAVSMVQTRTTAEQQTTTKPIIEAAASAASTNATTLQQVLATISANQATNTVTPTPVSNPEVLTAIQDNTEATKHNTEATEETLHNG